MIQSEVTARTKTLKKQRKQYLGIEVIENYEKTVIVVNEFKIRSIWQYNTVRLQVSILGCHFDCNEVKEEISHSQKVWNFRLNRLGEISPDGRNDIHYLAHLKTCSRTMREAWTFPLIYSTMVKSY